MQTEARNSIPLGVVGPRRSITTLPADSAWSPAAV